MRLSLAVVAVLVLGHHAAWRGEGMHFISCRAQDSLLLSTVQLVADTAFAAFCRMSSVASTWRNTHDLNLYLRMLTKHLFVALGLPHLQYNSAMAPPSTSTCGTSPTRLPTTGRVRGAPATHGVHLRGPQLVPLLPTLLQHTAASNSSSRRAAAAAAQAARSRSSRPPPVTPLQAAPKQLQQLLAPARIRSLLLLKVAGLRVTASLLGGQQQTGLQLWLSQCPWAAMGAAMAGRRAAGGLGTHQKGQGHLLLLPLQQLPTGVLTRLLMRARSCHP